MIDAHHHLWDPGQARYPWLEREQAAPLRRRFDIDDLRAVTAGHDVEGTVVIEARHSLDETRSLMAVAAAGDLVSGVVGWADLTDPGLEDVLAELRSEAGGDRLAGIRVELDAHEPDWLARADVLRGLRVLAAAGLAYDVLADAGQLGAAVTAARAVPELTVIVNHLGKPDLTAGEDRPWAVAMAALGALPNTWCKVSGGSAARIMSRDPEAMKRLVAGVRDWFGDSRLVFGSDWPVCTLSAPYTEVLERWRELLADLGPGDREATFGGNARRLYRLS